MMKLFMLVLALICLSSGIVSAEHIGTAVPTKSISTAPMSPKFADYMIKRTYSQYSTNASSVKTNSGSSDFVPGLVPEPFIMPKSTKVTGYKSFSTLPSTWDLRTTGKLTDIRNQGACGSCWAFAAIGSMESTLLPYELWDFSENNLKNNHLYDNTCCEGGNRAMATAYFARWDGPVSETDDIYNAGSCTSPSGLVTRKHVQDVIFLPDRSSSTDNDAIKNAIMDYGAVYTSFYWDSACYSSSYNSYLCSSLQIPNHAVCIVGWNDDFPSSNFPSAASGNGAFLIRNSWGTWGDGGYFWISYYDVNMGKAYNSSNPNENAVFFADSPNNYDVQYGYDELGLVNMIGYGTTAAWAAMKFTSTSNSVLRAVSTYFMTDGTSYQLKIYRAPTNKPTSGTLVMTKTGTVSVAGYHTIALDTPVMMTAGIKYSCVIKLTTPGYNYPVGFEYPVADYSSAATANAGETYLSADGSSWQDMITVATNASACLKTFASIPDTVSLVNIKETDDGDYVKLEGVQISAIYGDCLYVQDPDKPSGIRVEASASGFSLGDVVTVYGTINTYKPDGSHDAERQIESAFLIAQ